MRVCLAGHYIGKKAKGCACGERVTAGRKVSLFLPIGLHVLLAADAKVLGESISARIVRHIIRDRDRKTRTKKGA